MTEHKPEDHKKIVMNLESYKSHEGSYYFPV